MAGFLYYLPGRAAGLSTDEARAAGLAYAIDGPLSSVGVRGGPGGGDGALVALAAAVPPEQLRYEPDAQRWAKAPGSDVWVGMYSDAVPTPEVLGRSRQLDGHLVVLGDDRPWLVPLARGFIEEDGELRWYVALPQRSVLGEDGRWKPGSVVARFAPLWDLAGRFEESRRAALSAVEPAGDANTVTVVFDFDGHHRSAVEALACNYRIGPVEADLLGLLTGEIAREVLEAVIDLPTRIDWFKKKRSAGQAAGSNTAGGSPAATPATAPPAPTSGR